MVFNAEGYRIAASEHFKAKINDWGPENYPALIAMRQKKRIEILHPRSDEICKSCIYTSVCGKNAVLHIPLMEDENLLGCLSILWYQKVNLENFEGHIQYLIGLFTMLLNNEEVAYGYQDNMNFLKHLESLRFSALIEAIHEGVIVLDPNSCIRDINEVAVHLSGKPRFSLVGRHISLDFPEMPTFGSADQFDGTMFLHKFGKTYNLRFNICYVRQGAVPRLMMIIFEVVGVHEDYLVSQDKISFDSIIGNSKALQDVLEIAKKVAKTESTILIRGESGTGKELIVQAIHKESIRANGPFVAINCSAIPDQLLESELFGYESGTFTGAIKGGKEGVIQSANNGTL